MTAWRPGVAATLGGVLAAAASCAEPEEPLAPWAWAMPRCVAYQPERYEAPGRRVEVDRPREGIVTEVYEPGWGPDAFAEIHSVVRTCGSFEDGDLREQNLVVETGFGGDESVLVESVQIEPPAPMRTSYAAAVRDGDAVITVRVPGLDREQTRCLAAALSGAGADRRGRSEGAGPGRAEHATCRSGQT